ncbi:hypothetical protein AALO_G00232960 [Alosa alosa]|uniref:Uncharacterized protein n=1 Tax=Alosa alosa TaxID=278164 RepID=A0AAV6FVE5_9TELE|nr:hypothetical protein AALO_G00232960 [Alosa alosa]
MSGALPRATWVKSWRAGKIYMSGALPSRYRSDASGPPKEVGYKLNIVQPKQPYCAGILSREVGTDSFLLITHPTLVS